MAQLPKRSGAKPGATTWKPTATMPTDLDGHGSVWSPDGSRIYLLTSTGAVSVLDATAGGYPVISRVPLPGSIGSDFGIAISPDGTRLYVASNNNESSLLYVIDTTDASFPILNTIPIPYIGYQITVTPDGTKLFVASGNQNGMVYVIDTSSNSVSSAFLLPRTGAGAILPTPQGLNFSQLSSAITTSGISIAAPTSQSANSNAATNWGKNGLQLPKPRPRQKSLTLTSTFSLGSATNGIFPASELFRLMIGPFNVTIPKGCFKLVGRTKTYSCGAVIDGVTYNLTVQPTTTRNKYSLKANLIGSSLPSLFVKPIPVSFQIGNDAGRMNLD